MAEHRPPPTGVSCVVNGKDCVFSCHEFLCEPLIRSFGAVWYEELELTVAELRKAPAYKRFDE